MAVNANTQIYDKAIDRAAMIRLYERRVNGKVELVIDGHTVRVDKLIKEANLSQKGFEKLREAIDKELTKTYRETFNLTKRSLLDLVSDQVSYVYQNIETTMGQIWRTQRPQKRVAEEIVLEKPLIENRTLAAGWAGVSLNEKKRLESVIRKGISEGKTVDQIALEVRKGNVHNITRMQSKALVVTAITSVTAQTDQEVYKANSKALQGWQYVAVLDARTTPLCAHRDGTIYPIGALASGPL
jgi:SPP1 gp7 family putative phage head morphogenesis protein